ncbi:hypothetical protein [Clostridium saccharoperbutylacetonicum]|uniref:hypothetical protein n=1 Tax=Clostridium saccharoperbutylacetonicum TaxID=36745 RepID=UPI0039E8D6DB
MDIRNSNHIIKTKDEFFEYCDFAKDAIEFADKLAETDNLHWFFEECYSDWNKEIHFVFFKSYITQEFKDYKLSLKITKNSDCKYDIIIQKKFP